MKQLETLKKVAKVFNKHSIDWAVGASSLLYFYELVECPNDIDLIVNPMQADQIFKIMDALGVRKEVKDVEKYKTKVFRTYLINEVEVDIIGEFKIVQEKDRYYTHYFDPKLTYPVIVLDGVNIYLDFLEVWFYTYQKMGDPKGRVELIKSYLKRNKINTNIIVNANLDLIVDINQ